MHPKPQREKNPKASPAHNRKTSLQHSPVRPDKARHASLGSYSLPVLKSILDVEVVLEELNVEVVSVLPSDE